MMASDSARNREAGLFLFAIAVTIPAVAIILGAYAERSLRNLEAARRYQSDSAALHFAKGGLEKALWELSEDPGWRDGFTDQPIAYGSYTVVVEDDSDIPSLAGLVRVRAVGLASSTRGTSVQTVAAIAATHVIRTAVGNGDAVWNGDGLPGPETATRRPFGLALDSAGNLWFSSDSRIRKLDGSTGIVTTPVGAGYGSLGAGDDVGDGGPLAAARFMDPRGISLSADGTRLFIADAGNGLVRLANLGSVPIPLVNSMGIMRQVLPGEIDRIAGGWPLGFSGDGGDAMNARLGEDVNGAVVEGNGLVFVSDASNNRIRVINLDMAPVTVGGVMIMPGGIDTVYGNGTMAYGTDGLQATAVGMSNPGPVAIDSDGDLWVPIEGHNHVFRMERGTGIIRHEAGDRYASSPMDGDPARLAGLGGPAGLDLLPGGGWILSSRSYHTVRRIDPDGIIDTLAGRTSNPGFKVEYGPAVIARCNAPAAILAIPDSDGDFYFSDRENHRIRKVTREIRIHSYTER